jgi:fatty-acyl-CoA synthase
MFQPLLPIDFLHRAARNFPGKTAMIDGAKQFTYAETARRVNRFSNALARLGVGQGDRVAILAPNSHWMLESFFGVAQLGAVLVPINYRLTADDFRYILNHSGAKVLLLDWEYCAPIAAIRAELPELREVVLLRDAEPLGPGLAAHDVEALLEAASDEPPPPVSIDETDMCTLNYTSGTTARPKGVMLSHRALVCNALDFTIHFGVTYCDVYLHTLPMFHANGWGGIYAITAMGATHVSLRKVDAAEIFAKVARDGVTFACAAPTVLVTIASAAEAKPGSLRGFRIGTAGAPPPAAVIERMEALGARVTHVYGLTETGPFLTVCEWKPEFEHRPASERPAIKARQGISQVLADTRVLGDDLEEVPRDGKTIGEICARGHVLMTGYYNQPDETARAFAGGWFHSGDLAVVHPDGYIEIVDRKKDVIISGGENISSVEVEGILYKHPAVLEVAVIGVPDEKWGEVPRAIVVLRPGARATEEEIIGFARENMAHFKAPKAVDFIEGLPKTATGKTQKFALRERYWTGKEKRVQG